MAKRMTQTRLLSQKWELIRMKMAKMIFSLLSWPEQLLALDAWPAHQLIE